jgi:hypothetical protein
MIVRSNVSTAGNVNGDTLCVIVINRVTIGVIHLNPRTENIAGVRKMRNAPAKDTDPSPVGSAWGKLRRGGRGRAAAELGGVTEIPEQRASSDHRDEDDERE